MSIYTKWTAEDRELLASLWTADNKIAEIAAVMKREVHSVQNAATRFGLRKLPDKSAWTDDQCIELRRLWDGGTEPPEIASALGRTETSIRSQASRIGCNRRKAKRRRPYDAKLVRWTAESTQTLAASMKAGKTAAEIAVDLGKSETAVRTMASKLRLTSRKHETSKLPLHSKLLSVEVVETVRVIPCMTCRQPFGSTHKFHRRCRYCKERD